MITRRRVLQGLGAAIASGMTTGAYALGIEPYRLEVTRYRINPAGWPRGFKLKIAALADIHACDPWMTVHHIRRIVELTNDLGADLIVLLGDYTAGSRLFHHRLIGHGAWADELARLSAPLGVHAILGNHDWWDDYKVQRSRSRGPTVNHKELTRVGIPVFENTAIRLQRNGEAFWLAGLGDQWAYVYPRDRKLRPKRMGYEGVDDLGGTLAQVTDQAPMILLAHEPDIFASLPSRVAVTLSGHTHGGQITFAGYAPVVPSYYGRRYVYGHVVEETRHLVVSGGLGCSGIPLRLGRPPEIVLVELGYAGVA